MLHAGIIDLLSAGTLQGWTVEHDYDQVRDCKHASLNHWVRTREGGTWTPNTAELWFSRATECVSEL